MATNHVFDTPLVTDHVPADMDAYGYVSIYTVSEAFRLIGGNLDYIDADQRVPGLTDTQTATLIGLLNRIELGIAREFGEV